VPAAGGDLIVFWFGGDHGREGFDLHIRRRIKCPDDYEVIFNRYYHLIMCTYYKLDHVLFLRMLHINRYYNQIMCTYISCHVLSIK
jgi:hypothetical protein